MSLKEKGCFGRRRAPSPPSPGLLSRWEGLRPWGSPEVVSSVPPPSSHCFQGGSRGGWAPWAKHGPSKLWGLLLSTEENTPGWLPPSPRLAGSPDFKACRKHRCIGPGPGPQNLLPMPEPSSETLGKLLSPSVPQFPLLSNGSSPTGPLSLSHNSKVQKTLQKPNIPLTTHLVAKSNPDGNELVDGLGLPPSGAPWEVQNGRDCGGGTQPSSPASNPTVSQCRGALAPKATL